MAKQIRITFEKGGSFVADMLEDRAPVTCSVIWEALEKPWTEKFIHSNIGGFMVESPYFPVPEDLSLPTENLWCFTNNGDIAVIAPAEYREMSIRGYLPLCFSAWRREKLPTLEKLTGIKIDVSHSTGEDVNQQYKKNMFETCRANVFARIPGERLEEAARVVERIRTDGIEGFTIQRA
ncbi:MAG: DUF3830 family protein [Clostridium sp.]|nr:DUF3830 family protein [Clostridium sp.]